MKKIPMMLAAGVMMMLSSCGQAETAEEVRTDAGSEIAQISIETDETDFAEKEEVRTDAGKGIAQISIETNFDEKEDGAYGVLDHLIGEYEYASEDGTGKLMIQKTSDGYDISDYESESSYRFLADSSNIETIEDNRIYIEYPELLFSDDTVHFSYYILEYGTDGIDVYYGMTEPEHAKFLYHAVKQNGRKTEQGGSGHSVGAADKTFIT